MTRVEFEAERFEKIFVVRSTGEAVYEGGKLPTASARTVPRASDARSRLNLARGRAARRTP